MTNQNKVQPGEVTVMPTSVQKVKRKSKLFKK